MLRKWSTLQWLTVLLALSSLCAVSVSATKGDDSSEGATEEAPKKEEGFGWNAVKQLTTETFEEAAKAQDLSAVFFYAPWCGHCKNAKPAYEEAAGILAEEGIPLFAVDANEEENRPLASQYGVQGFPTIKILRKKDGEIVPTEYQGGRDTQSFVNIIKSYSGPATTFLELAPENFLKGEDIDHTKVTVVAFVDSADSTEAKEFEDWADNHRNDGYYYVTKNVEIAKAVHEDLSVKSNTLLLFRHFDGEVKRSDSIGTQKDIGKFIDANYCAPFLQFSDLTQGVNQRVFQGDFTYNVFMYGAEENFEKIKKWAEKLPEKFSGKISPTIVFEAKGPESRIVNYFGLNEELELSVAVVNLMADKEKYVMEESATHETTFKYIKDIIDGKIEPTLKSEPIPATNDEAVKVVVGKTFEEIVLGGKNVFLEIYAPWCGHCKALEPAYKELAEEMAEVDTEVVIAKLDGTANDIIDDRFEVRGFPTLFFVNSEGKVTKYQEAREKDAMKDFIEENKTGKSSPPTKETEDKEEI